MIKHTPNGNAGEIPGPNQQTELPSDLIEFDLDAILEYARAAPSQVTKKSKLKNLTDGNKSVELFQIVKRNWVCRMISPVALKSEVISQFSGCGVSRESSSCYKVEIEDFELKPSQNEQLLTIYKKQRGQIKRGALLSMHIVSSEANFFPELHFISSRIKKCKAHVILSGMFLVISLNTSSNEVTVSVSYRLDMVTSFYRYFSSDVSQALGAILSPGLRPYPVTNQPDYSAYEGVTKDNHLLYRVITDTTAGIPSPTQAFNHPSLSTNLLPFQRKSVGWLLAQESVGYNEDTLECFDVQLVSAELYQNLKEDAGSNTDYIDNETFRVFFRLCFGWHRVLYYGEVCWYNQYIGNIISRAQALQFLLCYYEENNAGLSGCGIPGCGLLSEEMGLGKTVEITTLIRLHPRPASEVGSHVSLQFKAGGDFQSVRKAKTTLIAAPESILRQWYAEICQICPTLSVTIYKGLGKYPELNNIPQYISEFLQRYDVVLLNYSTLSKETDYANYSSRHKATREGKKRTHGESEAGSDAKERELVSNQHLTLVKSYQAEFVMPEFNNHSDTALGQRRFEKKVITELADKIARRDPSSISHTQYYESPLMSCQWWRVVLDEVQMVSSGSTRAFATASILPRFHSWGVSGTPSVSPAVLQFLRLSPFNYDIQKYCWKLLSCGETPNEDFAAVWSSLALRHTKNMVYDDIKLPPQKRVLLTVPFTHVEQDKYNEILDTTLASVGADSTKTVSGKIDSSGFSYLRARLFKLRQLCGNLQVGKLPKPHSMKGRNKTKLLITGVRELKTLGTVLTDMIEGVEDEVSECEKAVVHRVLEMCSALEYVLYPELVIEVLNLLLVEIQSIINKVSSKNLSDRLHLRRLKAVLIRHDAVPRDSSGNSDTEDEESEAKGLSHDPEEPRMSEEEIVDHLAEFQRMKECIVAKELRLRSWKLTQHKCFFLLASAHFQLHDPEFQSKIASFKKPFNAVNEVMHMVKNSGILREREDSERDIKREIKRETKEDSEGDVKDNNKILEKRFYALAEECRRDILKHSIKEVSKAVERRIRLKGTNAGDWVNDGAKSFPKSTKKLFTKLPRIEVSGLNELVSNMRCKQVVEQFQASAFLLNAQADVINAHMSQLLAVLTNPLSNDTKDADGEEFDQSVQDQERASCLMLVISQMLTDRSNAVLESKTLVTQIERQQENEFKQEVRRVNDQKFLRELQKSRINAKPDPKVSMEECAEECRILEVELQSLKNVGDRLNTLDILKRLRTIFENEKASQSLLKREINASLNSVFNARVEYFRHLQQISDSVKNEYLDNPEKIDDAERADAERADAESHELLFQNLFRNLADSRGKLSRSVTRLRYLATLLPETSQKGHEHFDRDDVICIICQSPITVGSLTSCGHKFCKECLEEWLKRSARCPVCKAPTDQTTVYNFTQYKGSLKAHDLESSHEHLQEKSDTHQIYKHVDEDTLRKVQRMNLVNSYGSKVDLIVKQVLYLREEDPEVQIVVFSQWQDLLVILAFAFDKMGISYVSAKQSRVSTHRKKNMDPVDEFKNKTNIKTCFLLNSQAQSSGLTLINATHIFLCEPLINTSTELQAISRIHRIGQTKETTVWMFAIENTVEKNIVALGTKRRVDYFKANAREAESNSGIERPEHPEDPEDPEHPKDLKELADDELRAAESFALTLGTSVKSQSDATEYVNDEDLFRIYFGSESN